MNRIKNVIFMGTPEFAVSTLLSLVANHLSPILVVTQPDRRRGRGQKLSVSQVKQFCQKHNISVFQPQNINTAEAIAKLEKCHSDLIITAAYGKILCQKILDIPRFGCINLHPSLLPKYRGPSPINWALFNGEKETGNTVFFMTAKMDAGDVIYQSKMEILPEDNYGSLLRKLSNQGAKDMLNAISLIDNGTANPIPQNDNLATFSRFITKNIQKISWSESAGKISNQIRGLAPYPAAFTYFNKQQIKIIKAKIVPYSQRKPGLILDIVKNKGIIVGTNYDALLVETVKPAGKKVMSAYAFSLGNKLGESKRFEDGV